MTKNELLAKIKEAGFLTIPVKQEPEESTLAEYDGTFNDFLTTLKALGTKAILVSAYTFEEEDLKDVAEEEDYIEEEDDELEVDLVKKFPALAKYKKYIGEDYLFSLIATGEAAGLNLNITKDWYLEFEKDLEKALDEAE